MQNRVYLSITVSIVALAIGAPASAQVAAPSQPPASTASPTPQSGTEVTAQDIIVTATRRSENIRDVPIALTNFSQAQLTERHVTTLQDLAGSVSNVVVTGTNPSATPTIRGITSGVRNAGTDSGVAFYVDGVYTGRPDAFGQNFDDLQSLDVLKGPQGSLFGKNAIAGAIVIRSNDPVQDFQVHASAEVGNYGHFRGALTLNVPLARDVAAARFTVFGNNTNGFVKNLGTGADQGTDRYWGGRGKLKFTPSANLDITLQGDYRRDNNHTYGGENERGVDPTDPLKPLIAPGPYTIDDGDPVYEHKENYGGAVVANYRPGADFEITSITALRRATTDFASSQDMSPKSAIGTLWRDQTNQFTQELRLKSPSDKPFQFIAGLFYFYQKLSQSHAALLGPDFTPIPAFHNQTIVPLGTVRNHSYAAYIDATLKLLPGLTAFGSARITREIKDVSFSVVTPPVLTALFYNIPENFDHRADTDISPTVGLRYAITDRINAYVKVAKGYKSGGWNLDYIGASAAPAPLLPALSFKPESVTSYEVGLKGDLFDRRLRFGLAAYYEDYKDLQVVQFLGFSGGNKTSNAAKATIKGAEADVTLVVTPAFTLGGSVGYNHAVYGDYPGADASGTNAQGKRLFGPAVTGDVNADYSVDIGPGKVDLFAQVSYTGDSYGDVLNTPRLRQPAYALVNGSLSFHSTDGRWGVQLWAKNLFDKTYALSLTNDSLNVLLGGGVETFATYGRPRTFGMTVTFDH